ncbi:MAG: hypothetical protein WCI05_00295 [Myxococcales bacterium]|jgi:hypothetical protein
MIRLLTISSLAAALSIAPVQCRREPDPTLSREDTGGDALWKLAEKFRAEKNEGATRDTLRFLIDRYPSNRHAAEARQELVKMGVVFDGGT